MCDGFARAATDKILHQKGCEFGMTRVKVKDGESIDKAIRRFKKKCEKDGIVQDMRKKARFLKPSERRRKKQLKAEKRRRAEESR
ncbi:MAG: 30S ribosomal protein S21 [bacterium]